MRPFIAFLCLAVLCSRPAFAGDIGHPTQAQLDCRKNAPASPKKIVFGFSGWLSYDWAYGLIHGMMGRAADDTVEFHYEAWDSVYRNNLTEVVRCAYELATKRYRKADGSASYNSLVILGHSFGGNSAHDLAAMLGTLGVSVDLVVTADPRDPGNPNNRYAPSWSRARNVGRWLNFYEQNDPWLPGFPVTKAENTQIGGLHLGSPSNATLISQTEQVLSRMPVSRRSFASSLVP